MPTYEYECTKCHYEFEKFQSITEEPVKRCPRCRCKVKRLAGRGAGIIFRGSGFYETDYRRSGYTDAAKKEKEGGTSSKKPETSAGDKKSAGSASEKSKSTATSE